MTLLSSFRRLRRGEPCPVCEHLEWCLVSRDEPPSRALCKRVESKRRWKDAGWLHILREKGYSRPRARSLVIPLRGAVRDFGGLATGYSAAARPAALARLADHLGVLPLSLERLGVGWDGRNWSFPMSDASGQVRGIRLRTPSGGKLAVRGSLEGLFIPSGLGDHDRLLVCEGLTDTAAALTLGFDAIGLPSAGAGFRLVVAYAQARRPAAVVVVADNDDPGRRSASGLAATLACSCRDVRVVEPWAKDLREWLRAGATVADVNEAIARAGTVRVRIACRGGAS
ncbi:MAG: hypothetical protein IT431_07130 [Phycisphaerales bacterium]|nr:hypothetical protein [Phycisphaerales bacterium]